MPGSWAPLFGSLFCLVVVCCCVLTSLVPHHLREDLVSERERFWGFTSDILTSAEQQLETSLRSDPFDISELSKNQEDQHCSDNDPLCTFDATAARCLSNSSSLRSKCRKSCGVCRPSGPQKQSLQVQLRDGHTMPRIGLGTAGLGESAGKAVTLALQTGYRLIDSAQAQEWYREDLVGDAVVHSGIPREQLFLTSKLHPKDLGRVREQLEGSLKAFNTSYLDLFLLHYPRCWGLLCGEDAGASTWLAAWRDMEALVKLGKIWSIGVSNFAEVEVEELLQIAEVQPSVVQSRSDLFESAISLQKLCLRNGIQFQAYSSLGTQWKMQGHLENPVLTSPYVLGIAARRNTSAAQVALKWALQNGQAVIPRSSSQANMKENLAALDGSELNPEEMQGLNALHGTLA